MPTSAPAAHHLYLHGFSSGPASTKARHFRAWFAARGLDLVVPDLNQPDFGHLTFTGALRAIEDAVAPHRDGRPWHVMGSSMGGYLAGYWAQIHADEVAALVMLCPGFELAQRWPALLGPERMAQWRETGWLPFPDVNDTPTPVWWQFCADSLRYPAVPEPRCPTTIVHGTRDETVPIDGSRTYAAARAHVELVEIDDDHGQKASFGVLERAVAARFALPTCYQIP